MLQSIICWPHCSQTLDLFVLLCKQCGYPHVRLDGSVGQGKRQKLVTTFNDPKARC